MPIKVTKKKSKSGYFGERDYESESQVSSGESDSDSKSYSDYFGGTDYTKIPKSEDRGGESVKPMETEKKRGFWEAFGDKFEANSPEDKKKRLEKGEPEQYKDQPTKGYSSIGNRIGDVFEANSPQDKAKRLAIGQKETHQEQKQVEKEAKQRAENLQFKPEEVDARRDYYKRAGVDIDKAIDWHTRYGEVLNKDLKAKDRDWKSIAEKAKAEGLFDGKEDATKDLDAAYQFEKQGSKVTPAIFRQAVAKAISSDYDPKKLSEIETDYSDYAATLEPEGTAQQANRAFQRGLVEQIVKFPRSAQTMGAGLVDLVSPEGSRVDKFAQGQYNQGSKGIKEIDQKLIDQGVGQSKYDSQVVANLGGGAGSLTSSILMAGLAGGGNATKATSWFGKAKAALNPGVAGTVFGTNAGAEQYIGAIDNGKADWQAYGTALVAGAAEGYLEKLGLDKFMGAKGSTVKKFVTRSLSEGGQEASQSFAQAGIKSTYTSVDMSDALMKALEEGGYGAVIGGGGGLALSLAEDMKAKGVPPEVADATAEKVAEKISKAAEEELPEADGDTIAKELNGTQGTEQVPTSGDEIVKELQGGVVAPDATGEAVDGQPLPEDGDTIVKELQGNGEPMVNQAPTATPQDSGAPAQLPTSGDEIVKELQGETLNNLNPTGGVLVDYAPEKRATAKLGENITTLNETEGGSADDVVTIYRGAPTNQKEIAPGDYVTTSYELAKSYNGDGNVIEMKVRKGDVLDDRTESGGGEYIYRPRADKEVQTINKQKAKGSLKKLGQKTEIDAPKEGYTRYELNVSGQKIYADYNPNSMAGQTHVEFHGAKNNPISESGYKSHFTGEKIQEGNEQNALQDLADFFAKDNKKTYDAVKKKGAVKPLGKKKTTPSKYAVDQTVNFDGKKMVVVNVLKTDGDTKYELVDPNGSATKSVWTNEAALDTSSKTQAKKPEQKTSPKKSAKPDYEVHYPEGKDLPQNLKDRVPMNFEETGKTGKEVLKADNKLTPREVEIVTGRTIGWNKTQLKELIKNSKDLKENPVLTVVAVSKDTRYSDYRNSNLAIEYKSKDGSQMFRLPIDEIGFSRERITESGIKAGDTISIDKVQLAKGKVPVLRNTRSGVDYHAGTDNRTVESMGASDVARSPEELVEIINQLNRAGQKAGILRKGGLKSKKAAGLHAAVRRAEWQQGKLGTVKLRDDVLKNPSSYMTVLAHELSHAIEFAVNGTTGKTLELFGDLTAEEKKTITAELKEIVNNIEGADLAATDPSYFYKPTEMLARYVETLLLSPGGATDAKGNVTNTVAKQLAPVTTEKFEQAIVRHSAIGDLIEAVNGTLKDKSKIHAPNWWLDMRQIYQKHLGKQVGSIAYGAEVVRRAKMQRWQQSVGVFIKEKFKDVKDAPAQLFRVAEAIKQTDPDGNIVYGTRDFAKAESQKEIKELMKLGWEFVRVEQDRNGNDVALMAKQRYTEEQGKAMFAALSPEGQQLIRDYVARKENAKDTFNREYIKEVYNIDGNIEGWVHRGLRAKEGLKGRIKNRTTLGGKKGSLREKKAGTRKQRTAEGGHLEDLQKQLEKVLREVGDEKINNDFIEKQLARISKPLASGEEPDSGWVEVFYDKKKGIMLPGEGGRDKVTIEIQETEEIPEGFMSMSKPETVSKVTFLKPIVRLQVPAPLAEHYRNIRQVPQEISRAQKIMTNISKYWAINVLTHGGTVGTNFIGGGIQYSAKILEDFYVELATGKVTMPQTRRNVAAMVQVLTPRGWSSAPDYIYGGVRSSYAGQFMNKSKTETLLDKAGDIALTPMGMVESYWKKAVIIADQANTIPKQKLEKEMLSFSKSEEEMITAVNEEIDKVAYDYDNAPMWLDNWGRKGGLVKPFMKYPYKYAKQVTGLATGAFDRDLPLEVRIAKLMTLTTLVALSSALTSWRDDDKETPDGSDKTPSGLNPRGRLFLWKNGAEEMFVRTAKYPFVNITSIGKSMLQGDFDEARTAITDQLGTVGVGADLALILMGRSSEYEQYTPIGAQIGKRVATFIPGFRVLNDIGRAIDDKPRKQETFVQGIMSNLPVWWGGEETKSELRGDPRTIKIPVEPEGTRKKGDTETIEKDMKTYKSDLLLSALTGIYITRINPSDAKQQALREKRNAAEKRIEALLTDGKTQEANDVAAEAGLTIPKGTFDYYRRLREKRN